MILLHLFLAFLKIGLFAIGGAYSFFPLIEREVVERYQWLSKQEFLDIAGVTTIFPGAISIKYATYTGYKIAGIAGAISANLGNIFAPMLLVIFASAFYTRYKDYPVIKGAFDAVKLSVFAMIIAVAFQVVDVNNLVQIKSLSVIIISFIIFIYTKWDPAIIIILAAIYGGIWRR